MSCGRFAIVLVLAACGRIGFGEAVPATDLDAAPTPAFVTHVGTARCGGTQLAVSNPGVISVGQRLVATIVLRGITGSEPTRVSDSAGNAWALDHEFRSSYDLHVAVWSAPVTSAPVTSALGVAGSISASFPASAGSGLVVDALTGVGGVTAVGAGQANSKGFTVQTSSEAAEPSVLYCALGDQNHPRMVSYSWVPTASFEAACGAPAANPGLRPGPEPMPASGVLACNGGYASKTSWALVAVGYAFE